MKNYFKKILGIIIVISLMVTIVGCSGSSSASKAGGKKKEVKTLTLLMFTDWYTSGWQALEKHINENADELGFKLEIEKIAGGGQGEQILNVKFASDELPDLLQHYGPKYVDESMDGLDKLVDLTGISSINEYEDSAINGMYRYNDKLYSMPIGTTTLLGVFYNRNIFNDLGLSVPNTWSEFITVCEKIKEAGITPIHYAGKDSWTLQGIPHFGVTKDIIESGKDFPEFFADLNENKTHYADFNNFIDVIKKSKELIDRGFVNETYLSDTYDASQQAVAEGSAAMHVNGTWYVDEIGKKYPDKVNDIGGFPFPLEGNDYVNIFPPGSLSITTGCKDVELAKKAIDFIASAEGQQIFADAQPGLYLNKNVVAELVPAQDDLMKVVKEGRGMTNWQGAGNKYSYGPFHTFMQDYYVGGKTVEELVEAMDTETARDAKANNDSNWE